MNYSKIYDSFIADRRNKPPVSWMYAETHHIKPRAFGGSDDAANLVRLTPDDHLFAHLLLAKIYGEVMWFAAKAMVDMRGGTRCGRLYGSRPMFAVARKKAVGLMSGSNSPFADKTVYNLHHFDGRKWSGTKVDFRKEFGKAYQPLSAEGHWKGWYQSAEGAEKHKDVVRERLRKARQAQIVPSHDKRIYGFLNTRTNEIFRTTRLEMQRRFGLKPGDCCSLIKGRQKVAKGFSVLQDVA